ncbi:MAG: porin [Gammaproteobacteria bacterium]|jgi:hypothetical protein
MKSRLLPLVALASLAATLPARADQSPDSPPDNAELYQIIQAQQNEIDQLREQRSSPGDATHIGGYGELHFNHLDSGHTVDLSRFVLFFGHDFSDRVSFASELEIEHAVASADDEGEVEVEQAYVRFALNRDNALKAGLFLLPVGLLNETHEPPTFYGVNRNPVETFIIPTTWREAGVLWTSRQGAWQYDLGLHTGFRADAGFDIAEAHQEAQNAVANDPAATARVRYRGIAGLELAASLDYQGDLTQSTVNGSGPATLAEVHAVWRSGAWTFTGLYGDWSISGNAAAALDKDRQNGYYLEGSYRMNRQFGVFGRYSEWDTGGFGDTAISQSQAGFNYWPVDNVVIKFDLQKQGKAGSDDGFNIGLGYMF